MDIQSLGLGDIGGDVSDYFNKVASMGKNYPERLDRVQPAHTYLLPGHGAVSVRLSPRYLLQILVINVPAAFGMIWKIVAPMLDRNVRERISIHRADYQEALREIIDPENIPHYYGGTCQVPCPTDPCPLCMPLPCIIDLCLCVRSARKVAASARRRKPSSGNSY